MVSAFSILQQVTAIPKPTVFKENLKTIDDGLVRRSKIKIKKQIILQNYRIRGKISCKCFLITDSFSTQEISHEEKKNTFAGKTDEQWGFCALWVIQAEERR